MRDPDIIAASHDSPEQFTHIYTRYAPRIARFIATRVSPGDTEDVLAEVFCTAFDKRATFDAGYDHAGPWLFGIAANTIREHVRARIACSPWPTPTWRHA